MRDIAKHSDNFNRDLGCNISIENYFVDKPKKRSPSLLFPSLLNSIYKGNSPEFRKAVQYRYAPCPDKVNSKVYETLALAVDKVASLIFTYNYLSILRFSYNDSLTLSDIIYNSKELHK